MTKSILKKNKDKKKKRVDFALHKNEIEIVENWKIYNVDMGKRRRSNINDFGCQCQIF